MNKLKLTSVIAASLLAGNAMAEDVIFNGSLSESCAIVSGTTGELVLGSTSVGTSTEATATVTNNSDAAFTLNLTNPTDFTTKPNGFTGSTTLASSMGLVGANNHGGVTSSVLLDNAGTDTASISLSGNTDSAMVAGSYSATVVLTCVAL